MSGNEKQGKATGEPRIHRHHANPSVADDPTDDTATRIMEATHKLVGECGFEGTSIRDIAKESGTNPALVYYYYGSKDGLFSALANHNADLASKILKQASLMEGTARERVRHFMGIWMQVVCDTHRPIAPWFRRAIQTPGEHGEVLRGRVSKNIGILAGILEDGICRGELRKPD
ncbi:MAG: TetR/AcrR family transcriptional regulator, partial [Fibrobacterota bacterium]